MRKLAWIAIAAIPLAACGGGESASSDSSAAATPAAAAKVDPATAGTINGSITLDGEAGSLNAIQMAADPNCAKLHSSAVIEEFVVLGENGGLKNVFVHIKEGLEGMSFSAPSEPVVLDQSGCVYLPHVIGIQVGQTLTIRNSDETLHNIHATPKNNKEFNVGQPVKGMETKKSFDNVEVMVPFKCDVHKWMNSYAGVVDHPYFAVSGDDGSFSIGNVPPGEYILEVWHEKFGTQAMPVTVGESETVDASTAFKAE